MEPLAGETVLVTRPRGQARELIRLLQRYGARVLSAPTIRILPPRSFAALDRELRRLGSFDAVVFTSANGVESFFARARKILGMTPKRPARVYAIGPQTARALKLRGWRVAGLPEAYEGAALARALGPVRGLRILIPRARVARKELPRLLKARGADVRVVEAYRTAADPKGQRRIRKYLQNGQDSLWVTFTSPSTVRHFMEALSKEERRCFFQAAKAASIGPITSAALSRYGIRPATEAKRYTAKDLARSMAKGARKPQTAELRRVLVTALRRGGQVLRQCFGKVSVRYKGRANIVTEADHLSEARILKTILGRFPSHDFLTEERPGRSTGSDFLWVIDPLDGTTNYAHGFPFCCVSIGLLRRGRPLVAGVYDPFRDEMFLAERGRGATLNGRPLSVSRSRTLSKSLLLTGFAYDRAKRSRYYLNFYRAFMERCHDVRRSGSAAMDLAWTAAARVDGFWEFNLAPWDVAAGMLLVSEAGGKVTDFSGKAWGELARFGRQTLATNGRVHGQMLRLIARYL